MVRVQLGSQEQYDVVAQTIGRAQPGRWLTSLSRDELVVEIDHPVLAKLIERVRAGVPVILPYPGRERDSWLIAGTDRRELDQTMERASRFVLPSYVEWSPADTPRLLKQFNPALNDLQRAGALLFGAGYYTWQSPPALFGRILDRLNLWMDLEARRPRIQSARLFTYHELHEQFSAAITAGRWAEAEQALQEMQQRNLIGADNLAFLQVQLLHHQQRWRAIWERVDFETLARLRMPRPVRAAPLTAFHQSVLLPPELEGRFEEALASLQ
ncbi:MAG TPA: hypothetical protein VLA19_29350, partial [Herpetosiphonaceae bacterium]|nr:hypothetical protein [Herpetosiphonaceae bacterium]